MYTFRDLESMPEVINIRVTAYGPQPEIKVKEQPLSGREPSKAKIGSRRALFEEYKDYIEVPVYDGSKIEAGNVISGPAIVEEPTTTIVVVPRSQLELDRRDVYVMTFEAFSG